MRRLARLSRAVHDLLDLPREYEAALAVCRHESAELAAIFADAQRTRSVVVEEVKL